ncbi:MAG: CRISPR-associated protein Cas4 [Candidatus Viridilinea halotolerans]|uniref:CRISPR-associated exonuclease Cas4 n=1 Tax=Candidatus Viridilinea halotolerans TaxID=2491704 RepID=A0A426TTI7_9CHLR|nr:MAG: CRISPR-associated protein Cas4 [Candidatus Viridilinea halotolerans]
MVGSVALGAGLVAALSLVNLALGLIALALLLLTGAVLLRRRTGLPWARVRSEDVRDHHAPERPLYARRYGLTGRPDYLLERHGHLIPVEVKPSRSAPKPYPSDLMQLAAYCLLVEETSGQAPPYGLLRYADTTFRLAYTPAVRAELLATIEAMHEILDAEDVARSHEQAARCRGCSLRGECDDALE